MNIQLLETLRKKNNLRQKDLTELLGYKSTTTYNSIVKGKRKVTADELKKLSELFGVSMEKLCS